MKNARICQIRLGSCVASFIHSFLFSSRLFPIRFIAGAWLVPILVHQEVIKRCGFHSEIRFQLDGAVRLQKALLGVQPFLNIFCFFLNILENKTKPQYQPSRMKRQKHKQHVQFLVGFSCSVFCGFPWNWPD